MQIKRIKLGIVLFPIGLLLIILLNPLGLRTAAEKHSEDLAISFYAPWHPAGARQDITVILLDDAFLQQYSRKYPVPYRDLSHLLKVIGHFQPKAVFFDLLQHYEHSKGVERWLRRLKQAPYPVYLASNVSYDTEAVMKDPLSLRSRLNNVAEFTAISWSGQQHYYPLFVDWNQQELPTAAMSLYQTWCRETPSRCKNKIQQIQDVKLFSEPMIVRWSNQYDQRQAVFLRLSQACQNIERSKLAQLWAAIRSHLEYGFTSYGKRQETNRHPCPPVLAVSATKLFAAGSLASKDLVYALKDRMVLVGYNLQGAPDMVRSPVNGSLSGVFYHAVALDNLINFGDKYWHVSPSIEGFGVNLSDVLEGLLQALVLLIVTLYRYQNDGSELGTADEDKVPRIWLISLFSLLLGALCLVWVSHYIFSLGPVNWYVFLIIVAMAAPTLLGNLIKGRLTRFFDVLKKYRITWIRALKKRTAKLFENSTRVE